MIIIKKITIITMIIIMTIITVLERNKRIKGEQLGLTCLTSDAELARIWHVLRGTCKKDCPWCVAGGRPLGRSS